MGQLPVGHLGTCIRHGQRNATNDFGPTMTATQRVQDPVGYAYSEAVPNVGVEQQTNTTLRYSTVYGIATTFQTLGVGLGTSEIWYNSPNYILVWYTGLGNRSSPLFSIESSSNGTMATRALMVVDIARTTQ